MNLLITAGGTNEKIDQVRSITNHSTGKLGEKIADAFLADGHIVTYVTTQQAIKPNQHPKLTIKLIETTHDLEQTLLQLFEKNSFDAIIHSMAVSDFAIETTITEKLLVEKLGKQINDPKNSTQSTTSDILSNTLNELTNESQNQKKISSDTDRLFLVLKKNPKIIAMIRKKQAHSVLVGFKLLVDVPKERLIQVGKETLEKNQCDFVLANDLEQINGDHHLGFLIDAQGHLSQGKNKSEIAQLLLRKIKEKMEVE